MYLFDDVFKLYINTSPLLISGRVLKAAQTINPNLRLEWDEDGFVCAVSHDLAQKLTARLGIKMLTVEEYMELARRHPCMKSKDFAEWLADTFAICTKDQSDHYPAKTTLLRYTSSKSGSDQYKCDYPGCPSGMV